MDKHVFKLISTVFLTGGLVAASVVSAANSNKDCMKIDKPKLERCNVKGCVLRDQFSADQLLALSQKLVHDFGTGNSACTITLPVWSWTGDDPIPTRDNLATETIVPSSLSGNALVEHLLSLAGLIIIEQNIPKVCKH